MMTPKLRNQLRQADKVADSGKRSAAIELYQQILAEDDTISGAWAGLGNVLSDEAERENAYQKALALDPESRTAQRGLAKLKNEPLPDDIDEAIFVEGDARSETSSSGSASGAALNNDIYPFPADISDYVQADGSMVCYADHNHPTTLRCNRCGRPICSKHSKRTSVGYRCPVCIREIEEEFFTAETKDYFIASAVSIPISLILGTLVAIFGGFGGIFIWFILFAVGGALGSFVGRVTFRAIGRRRGRYLPYVVATIVALGAMLPALIFGSFLSGAIYAFAATSAAYYQLR